MAESTVSTNYYGYLEAVAGKGPCRDSESIYRSCKKVYKKMLGLCQPLDKGRYKKLTVSQHIILSEEGGEIGCAPGFPKKNTMEELKGEISSQLYRLIESDTASGDRARDYHEKLSQLVEKISILLKYQHQQTKADEVFVGVQEAFKEVILPVNLERLKVKTKGRELDVGSVELLNSFTEATSEATALASRSKGEAVLLTPMRGGWREAVEAAQEAKILQPNFPPLSTGK